MKTADPKTPRTASKDPDNAEYDEDGNLIKPKDMKKSDDLELSDLEKSIGKLQALADDDGPTRKQSLLSKASTDTLTKSEKAELFQVLGGDSTDPTEGGDLSKSIRGAFDTEPLNKAIDVSDYLRDQQEGLEKSLSLVVDSMEKSDHRRHEYNLLQARALVDIGNLVKSMADTIDTMAGRPARAPKSRGATAEPLQKGFGGMPAASGGAATLARPQVLDGLEELSKSRDTVSGEGVALALTKFEGTNEISPNMLRAVQGFWADKQAAH